MNVYNLLRNMMASVGANIFIVSTSVILVLFLPRIMGVREYGYWQLYIFYLTLGSWMHLGWIDGIYLRYAGQEYSKLNFQRLGLQFWLLIVFEMLFVFMLVIVFYLYGCENEKLFIIVIACVSNIILSARNCNIYILQITNRIEEYAWNMTLEKILLVVFAGIWYLLDGYYQDLILYDVLAKMVALLFAMYSCKELFMSNYESLMLGYREAIENVNAGIKLMIANMAGILILSVIRWGISEGWDIITFGKISLILSVSNFLLVFINAISIVLFPILKKISDVRLADLYLVIRNSLSMLLLVMLTMYFPVRWFLNAWLPEYSSSLEYLAILFPMCLFESKVSLLFNTYLKAIRKEKYMFYVNVIILLFSLLSTYVTVYVINDLWLVVCSIVLLLGIRSICLEAFLSKYLRVRFLQPVILEVCMVLLFMLITGYCSLTYAAILYSIVCALYILLNRDIIKSSY